MDRRAFMKSGAMALLALGFPPEFLRRSLFAQTAGAARGKTLICIFQRGAVDGLSMVVPFGEKAYYEKRSSIALAQPGGLRDGAAIDLDGFFGLNPALQPLVDLYRNRELAIVHAVGSPDPSRSHFDAQDYMETATPGQKTSEGWLNRVLRETSSGCAECDGRTLVNPTLHAADHRVGQQKMAEAQEALRGIALGAALPLSLRGSAPSLAIADLDHFGIAGGRDPALADAFMRLYQPAPGGGTDAVSGAADDAFEAIRILKAADPAQYTPAPGANYPAGEFGRSLRQIAQLVKANVGLEIAFADVGGWDTHFAQGGANGQLARRLSDLAQGLRALHDDLGDRMRDVVILTMSEFGRTVAENGSGGTDHGHANCMFVLGGSVSGGKVHGQWPGLAPEQLYQGRDLAVTTDFRDIFAELTARHLGASHLERIFPGYDPDPKSWRGLLA